MSEFRAVLGICDCGRAVSANDHWAAVEVTGWQRLKDKIIRGSVGSGNVKCRTCFQDLKVGVVNTNQEKMF